MTTPSLPASLKRYKNKIEECYFAVDTWNVWLKDGWMCTITETHLITESSLKECVQMFSSVVPCDCAECKQILSEKKASK